MSKHIYLYRGEKGWQVHDKEFTGFCRLHQLTAISSGADPHEIFGGDKVVHHENEMPWDGRPSNLSVVTREEHRRIHAETEADTAGSAEAPA